MGEFPTPVIVVSKCLGFAACRYDGEVVQAGFVSRLDRYARLVTVCPELEIGLGVPRDKIRLVGARSRRRLVQPATGRDLTETMRDFAAAFLDQLGPAGVDGVILKSRSPSCGLDDAKIFAGWETEDFTQRGAGEFARVIVEAHPGVAVADEVRLADPVERRAFLKRVYEAAWSRERPDGAPPEPPWPPGLD